MTDAELMKLVEVATMQLSEHFDSVQIMVSWVDGGQTKCRQAGAGNWYARQGMAHEFINADVAQDTARQIAERLKPDDEDGD